MIVYSGYTPAVLQFDVGPARTFTHLRVSAHVRACLYNCVCVDDCDCNRRRTDCLHLAESRWSVTRRDAKWNESSREDEVFKFFR